MKSEPRWLLLPAVQAMHEQALAEFGGASGLRNRALLESALERPRNLRHYEHADLFVLAAAYTAGVVQSHPFVDGNKRTGFLCAFVFLNINGCTLMASEAEVVVMTLGLADRKVKESEYAQWLRQNTKT
jgi:death-on-curing protein